MPFLGLRRVSGRKTRHSANGTLTPIASPAAASSQFQSPPTPPTSTIQVHIEDAEVTQRHKKRTIFDKLKAWLSSSDSSQVSISMVEEPQPVSSRNGASLTTALPISQPPSKAPSFRTLSDFDGKNDPGMSDGSVDDNELDLTVTSPTSSQKMQKRFLEAGKATASVANYTTHLVKESSDVLPPLKSVASGLCFLLDTYAQWVTNKEDMTRLIRQIKQLQKKFEVESNQDRAEIQRRRTLTKQLNHISQQLDEITKQTGLRRFAEAGNQGTTISRFINDIRDAILEYQVSLQMFMYEQNNKQIEIDLANRKGCWPSIKTP